MKATAEEGEGDIRLERMRAKMATAGIDVFFVRGTSNISWLTAFDDVFDDEDAHALLIDGRRALLHTDTRYEHACESEAQGGPIIVDAAPKPHPSWFAGHLPSSEPRSEGGGSPRLGIEDSMTLGEFRSLQAALGEVSSTFALEETASFVFSLRAVKDAREIARMRKAQAVTDAAFSHIASFAKPGMTERAVQIELDDFMMRHGASGLAFPTIVATGPRAASPHARPGDAKLEPGQCVVMDFGARACGYCSDMTRVLFVGEPDDDLRDAYSVLREANESVEAMIRPGLPAFEAHARAEEVLAAAGFAGTMGHALGHGVGIDIHELPVLAPRNQGLLEIGNVVTVEPGIYLPGRFGMRLEDFGAVIDGGFDVFTKSTHGMVII